MPGLGIDGQKREQKDKEGVTNSYREHRGRGDKPESVWVTEGRLKPEASREKGSTTAASVGREVSGRVTLSCVYHTQESRVRVAGRRSRTPASRAE